MFFDDPGAAFANIRRALRPAGRLVMMVWQAHERNEWDVAIHQSLAEPKSRSPSFRGPDPFSLADPPAVKELLELRGSSTSPSPTSTSRSTTVRTWPPPSTGSAASRAPARVLNGWIPPPRRARVGRLREALAAHLSDDGVWFDSRAWIVTAHRH